MKNNKIYCKFVSQVKSSAKIISLINNSFKTFLIALLFILLFSISCKSKQNPNEHSREELVGTWKATYLGSEYILNIDSEGNFIFNCGLHYEGNGDGYHYNFAGKLADTFEYPYTIELTFTASSLPYCFLYSYWKLFCRRHI